MVSMVPVSSRPHECDLVSTSRSFPFTRYLVARCSNAFRTVICAVVFKCPGWLMVAFDPSLYIKFIFLTDSPRFLNIDARARLFLPREESAGAFLRPRVSLCVPVFPNPLSALCTPPLVDSEGALLVTIRHPPRTRPQLLPPHLEWKP